MDFILFFTKLSCISFEVFLFFTEILLFIRNLLFCNKLELKYLCKKTISVNFWSAKESQSFILLFKLSSLFKSTGLCKSEQDEETINLSLLIFLFIFFNISMDFDKLFFQIFLPLIKPAEKNLFLGKFWIILFKSLLSVFTKSIWIPSTLIFFKRL